MINTITSKPTNGAVIDWTDEYGLLLNMIPPSIIKIDVIEYKIQNKQFTDLDRANSDEEFLNIEYNR